MIDDLSQVLKRLLEVSAARFPDRLNNLAEAVISFDRPSESFNPSQTTVNLFLYDIRENVELRNNEPTIERNNGTVTIRQAPLRVDCSYLVTAWAVGGEELELQEHRLLSQVLQVLSGYPTIPEPFLEGTLLAGQTPPLPVVTAQMHGLQNPAEFWNAIGNQLHPSITVTATISIEPLTLEAADYPIVIAKALHFKELVSSEEETPFFQIGGHVTDAESKPIQNAAVTLVEQDLSTVTNASGAFNFSSVAAGNYTLRVQWGDIAQAVEITVPAPIGSHYNVQLV